MGQKVLDRDKKGYRLTNMGTQMQEARAALPSGDERKRRAERTKAQEEVKSRGTGRQKGTRPVKKGHLTLDECLGMVSSLARLVSTESDSADCKPSDRKHNSVSLGVMVDKWAMLTGRPTQVIKFADADKQRPAIRELAGRIVQSAKREAA